MEERRRAILIGASSGLGAALAVKLTGEGYDTALVARRPEQLAEVCERIKSQAAAGVPRSYTHDVRRTEEVGEVFERIAADLHGVDLVIYVAGIMPDVGPDEYDTESDRAVLETNTLGAIAWLNEAARWFQTQRAGTIVGISSMAGERGRRGFPAYCASKAAVNTYLESLRNRLSRYGVHVLTVKPGFVRTRMLEGRSGLFWVTSPEDAADQIFDAIERRRGTVFVSRRWRLVSWIIRLLPSFLFRRLSI
jgi:short-subunit dehydrogenase